MNNQQQEGKRLLGNIVEGALREAANFLDEVNGERK